jgi:hypothetical protein
MTRRKAKCNGRTHTDQNGRLAALFSQVPRRPGLTSQLNSAYKARDYCDGDMVSPFHRPPASRSQSFGPCYKGLAITGEQCPLSAKTNRRADIAVCLKCAMCGRLRVGKKNIFTSQAWSVLPCVRPLGAVHMTAGHNALRGSGPSQQHAFDDAMAQVGCPDRRIDRLCITCCSPSQPSHHAGFDDG